MPIDTKMIFILVVVFQLKHYLCDFPLQTHWMLRKVADDWGFFLPLASHCAVHAVMTLVIVMLVNPAMWWLCFVDGAIHFVMDRIKAGSRYLGRFRDRDKPSYWNALGFDQMVHHLTSLCVIWFLANPLT